MPITTGNFEKLVSQGFYDGIIFHGRIDRADKMHNGMIEIGLPFNEVISSLISILNSGCVCLKK